MVADASIFAQYLRAPKSVMDYSAEMDANELQRMELGTQRMKQQAMQMQQQQAAARQNAIQRIFAQHQDAAAREGALMADPLTVDVGQAQREGRLKLGKLEAETEKERASATKTQAEAVSGAIKNYRSMLDFIDTPQAAARWMQAQYADPVLGQYMQGAGPVEQAIQRIPTDPQGFARWREMSAMGMEAHAKKVQDDQRIAETGRHNRASETISVENNRRTVNASMANAAAARDAARITADATREAARAQRDQSTEMKLADDYRAQSKDFTESLSAHKQLTATLGSATSSPAATLAAATKFMKILDPGSVVRESELGMALAASGVLDRAMNYVSTLNSGRKLTATQAKDFKDISDKMFNAAKQVQQTIDADYKAKAKTYGLRPEMVVQDLGQNATVVNFEDLK